MNYKSYADERRKLLKQEQSLVLERLKIINSLNKVRKELSALDKYLFID
jgi:hypothetical protein